ncbi:MAG: competence/damage-inducible protein A [Clostridia bacterium]|nr:competence/damage-inducible protein A [Clostridia bacterium]
MKCCIIAIGAEVVSGDILNTNGVTIANYLKPYGIKTVMQLTVDDCKKDIVKAIKRGLKKADLVITTGGLGPTYDDITKKAVAKALDRELIRDEYSVEMLNLYFRRAQKPMPQSNLSQCYFPKGSQIVQNPNGTAPACITGTKEGTVMMLPGPPIEVEALLRTEEITSYFDSLKQGEIVETTLKFFGIGESHLEEVLSDYMKKEKNLILAPYAKTGEVQLKITAKGDTREEAITRTNTLKEKLYELVGEYIYTEGDRKLEEVLLDSLKQNGQTLATAESCTGGMIGQMITAIPGSSDSYFGGAITYSNELKQKICNVSSETLSEYGAVSKGTACEMAEGIRLFTGADIGVSVTGIAGPGGGTEEKPVGLVYVGISTCDKTDAFRFHFVGNRDKIRQLSAKNALHLALCASKSLGEIKK